MSSSGARGPFKTSGPRRFLDLFIGESSTKTKLSFMAIAIASLLATAFIVTTAGMGYVDKIHTVAIGNEKVFHDLMEIKASALSTIMLDPASPETAIVFADAGRSIQENRGSALENIGQPEKRRGLEAILSQWRDYERDAEELIRLSPRDPKAAKEGIEPLYKTKFIPFQQKLGSFINGWGAMTDKAGHDADETARMVNRSVSFLLVLITGGIIAMMVVISRSINADLREKDESFRRLQQNEALLDATQRIAKTGGWEYDVEKQTLFWTDEVYRIHDLAREAVPAGFTEHIAKSLECFAPEARPVVLAALQKCAAEGVEYDMEFPFTSAKGRRMWIRMSGLPLFESDKVVKVIGDIMDITERKAMEGKVTAERNKLLSVIESLEDGVYIVNREYDIEYINPVIKREFGPVGGRKCYQYFHDRAEPCPWCKNPEVFSGRSVRWEWYSKKNDRYYDLFDTPIKNADGTVSKFEIFHDVTEHKKMQEALRQSEEMLEKTFSSLDEAILVVDPRNRAIVSVNPATERIFGYPRAELLGKNTAFLYENEEKYREFGRRLFSAFEKDAVFNAEYRMRRKNGEIFETEHTVSKVLDESGHLLNVVSAVRDITQRKRSEEALRESEERYRQVFHASKAVKLLIEPETGKLCDANEAACHFYGYPQEVMVSKYIYEINTLTPAEINVEMMAAKTEKRNYFNFRHLLSSGEVRDVEVYSSPITIGGKTMLHSIIHDITERKAIEGELVRAKEAAEEATRLKDKFVSLVAHDLKSPLTSMTGFLKLVRDDEAKPLDNGAKLILDRAIDSGWQMARLIEDLLNLNRLKTGQLKLDKQFFDAKYLGAKMCADLSYSAEKKGIKLTNLIPDNSRVFGDRTLLAEALQNLATNAIKFCRKGDSITISLSDASRTSIQVNDTGPGMKPAMLERLFKYETRVTTVGTAGEPGTGFGLPLAKDIMLLHGGDLEVASEAGKGSTFTLRIPYVRPQILIVDDDPSFRFLLGEILKKADADITEAEDGASAADIITKGIQPPHLIISDIEMPKMTGLELLSYLQKRHETQSIPVIIVSGKHGMEIRDTVYGLGGKDFVTKELDVDDFIPRVRKFIG